MESESPKNENSEDEILDGVVDIDGTQMHESNPELDSKGHAHTQLQNEILYLKAEFDNYKKRMLREQDQSIRFGNEKLIRELLTVVDLFDRGVSHGRDLTHKATGNAQTDLKAFLSGVEMTSKELSQLLTRFGVEFVGTVGEKFDPAKHEALTEVEVEDTKVGTVIQVAQRGCYLHGRLLTPARVVVGKNKH
jgi:molecular chaperone GrpE